MLPERWSVQKASPDIQSGRIFSEKQFFTHLLCEFSSNDKHLWGQAG